jgi:hypothetical protein
VDALTGASTTMGNTNTALWDSVNTPAQVTVSSITAGSWIYVAGVGENTATFTPVTSTTEHVEALNTGGNWVAAAAGANVTGTSGNILVGWTGNSLWGTASALEIKKQ